MTKSFLLTACPILTPNCIKIWPNGSNHNLLNQVVLADLYLGFHLLFFM